MERELPPWQAFDPDASGHPTVALGDAGPGAHVVAVMTTPGAAEDGWSARVATVLARDWTSQSERVLLADLNLTKPCLHEVLGFPNGEGVSDVVLWGASFQRVAHVVEPGLLFASAGTVVADPTPVLTSPRWGAITDGFHRADATLIAYLPVGAAGGHDILDRASDIVLLAKPEETVQLQLVGLGDRVRAVFGPEFSAGQERAVFAASASEASRPPLEEEALPSSTESPWESEAATSVLPAESSRNRAVTWAVGVFLIAATVVAAAWSGLVDVPLLTPLLAGSADPEVVTPPPAAAAETEPSTPAEETSTTVGDQQAGTPPSAQPAEGAGTPVQTGAGTAAPTSAPAVPPPAASGPAAQQSFSLTLAAYESLAAAEEEMTSLERRRPDLLYAIAPINANGTVFNRLLIGPASNGNEAEALRGTLQEALGVSAAQAGTWRVRETNLAFHLADEATPGAAQARIGELRSAGIPAYALRLSVESVPTYRIYAGAYSSPGEASELQAQLAAAGFGDAPLIPRMGDKPE